MKRFLTLLEAGPFFSLSLKLIFFMSVIIILTCSSLSWYLLNQEIKDRTQLLLDQGNFLSQNLAHNGRYGFFAKDEAFLRQLVTASFSVKEVIYAVFTHSTGEVLLAQSKGRMADTAGHTRNKPQLLLPEKTIVQKVMEQSSNVPVMTSFRVTGEIHEQRRTNHGKAGWVMTDFLYQAEETIFDFAFPVLRVPTSPTVPSSLAFELQQESTTSSSLAPAKTAVYGVVQVGLSDIFLQKDLGRIIQRMLIMTLIIIVLGIVLSILFARRLTTPLQALTTVASRVKTGDFSMSLQSQTHDEIGTLSTAFDQMTAALRERNLAVKKQIHHLDLLHQVGTLLSSSLSVTQILPNVLQILIEQSEFQRAVLALYNPDRRIVTSCYRQGFPDTCRPIIPEGFLAIGEQSDLLSQVLRDGKTILAHDLNSFTHPFREPVNRFVSEAGVISCILVPLQSDHRTMGILAVDKGPVRCEINDLESLKPFSTKLALAIDRSTAHQELEALTHTLEGRVSDRTRELQKANDKLQHFDELKSKFVTTASHELRTPLTSIKVFVENMLQGVGGPLSDEQQQYLQRIRANVDRLRRLISELLDLTQIETGRLQLSLVMIRPQDVLQEAIESMRPLCNDKGVMVREDGLEELPTLHADRDKLMQIFTNLIHNALKFTPSGGSVEIIGCCAHPTTLQICISDSGCGITADDLPNIFLPFFRSQSTPSTIIGAGLGLAVTKHLVELHHGELTVESTVGQGSQFSLVFPLRSVSQPAKN